MGSTPCLLYTSATPCGLLVLLLVFDWRLGLLSLVPVVLGFLIMMTMTGKKMQEKMKEYQNALDDMSNEAVEYVRGIPVVKTFGQTIFSFKKFKDSIDRYKMCIRDRRKIWRNPQAVIGLGLIVLICAVALLAPLLAPHAPDEVNPLMKYQAPSADYPLGTDQLGRCELSRLLYGARASLGLALPILILLGGIGLILGMMTACIGGWFDRVVTGISQVFIAFPTLIIAVAIIGVLGNGDVYKRQKLHCVGESW